MRIKYEYSSYPGGCFIRNLNGTRMVIISLNSFSSFLKNIDDTEKDRGGIFEMAHMTPQR